MSGNGLSDAVSPAPFTTAFPAVSSFSIAGTTMPGKWTLTAADKMFGWQIQQGYGLSGAFVFPKGDELVVAKFKGEFWSSADYAIFQFLRKAFLIKPVLSLGGGILTSSMAITHPELTALGISAVVPLRVTPTIQEPNGLWVTQVDFLQYRKPLPAPKKPVTVIPDVKKPPPVAKEDYEIENERLTAEILTRPLGG